MIYPLLTTRLRIEPLKLSDLDAFVGYRQDPEIARFQSWDTGYSAAQAFELIESQAGVSLPKPGEWLQLAIHEKINGELVGDLALHSLIDCESVFEIGFTLASKQQGKGFALEAASKLLNSLFAEVGANKIIPNTDRRNKLSIKLLLKLGFELHPNKSWADLFKDEFVTVDYYECLPQVVAKG